MSDVRFLAPAKATTTVIEWVSRPPGLALAWVFSLRWADRTRHWYFGCRTLDGQVVQRGIRVVGRLDLLFGSTDLRPPGKIYAADTANSGLKPPRDAWRTTWELRYRDPASFVGESPYLLDLPAEQGAA